MNQQKSIILKPTNFQLKFLAMSFCEDASFLKEVQEVLKDNLFVGNINKCLIYINEVNDEFEFKNELLYFKELLYMPLGSI